MDRSITFQLPGEENVTVTHLVVDFNGTLAVDGTLIDGVDARLREIAHRLEITVVTADTFGTARRAVSSLPVLVHTVATGVDKARCVSNLGGGVVVVGNGRNDAGMFRVATLAIAVLGREGLAPELLGTAAVIVKDIRDALDLLIKPTRLIATRRA
ncbi:MAG: ATPase P [Candidatus Binatia bacterium]